MRRLLRVTLLVLSTVPLLTCERQPAPKRNLVLIVVDTLRRDHLAAYGYGRETAPFLSELARRGTRFDGLSPSSWTKPATTSLLTGLHPVRHQTFGRPDALPAVATTLAQSLSAAGYDCVAVSANGWISPLFGFDRGFREFVLREGDQHAVDLDRGVLPRLASLREPFFLYVHYIDPHLPYEPRTDWQGRPMHEAPLTVADADAPHFVARSPQLLRRAVDLYDGEIRGADDGVRLLVEALRARGLLRSTELVVASDHGEELGDHGRMSHGQTLYDEVLHVPLLFVGPGVPRGRHLGLASLLDVVPTVRELLGVGAAPDVDGRSLVPAFEGQPLAARPYLAHLDFIDGAALALLAGNDKLVLAKEPFAKQVFDVATDPGERHDLATTPRGQERLRVLGRQEASLYDAYSRRALEPAVSPESADVTRRLAAVGYAKGIETVQRRIPRRVVPPDTSPLGSLGWDPRPPDCVQPAMTMAPELLAGWYAPESTGRWTAQRATLRLSAPDGARALVLEGVNSRPTGTDLTVRVDGHDVLRAPVHVGPFRLEAPLRSRIESAPALIELDVSDVFQPSRHGGGDVRELGLFYGSICLR